MIGIDISDRSIKVAEVTGSQESPHLRTVCWDPLDASLIRGGVIQDVDMVANALLASFDKCSPVSINNQMAVASIPENQSFVRVIDLPAMDDSEVDEAVSWAVRQHIPFDLDRMYLDWEPVPVSASGSSRRQVLVGAVQKEVVDPLLEVLDTAGVQVVALELEAQAIVRALLPRDAGGVEGVLVLDLGANATNIIFFDQGIMRFTTSIERGGDDLTKQLVDELHIQPSQAAEVKALVGLKSDVVSNDFDRIAVKSLHDATISLLDSVKTVVQELSAQQQHENFVRAILLSGGSASMPGLRELVAEVFPNIPVQRGNPWTNIYLESSDNKAPLSAQDASHFVTALGLALRQEEV